MQELKRFSGGACLVISQDGVDWFCKKRCTDENITKRDGNVQLWISKNHMDSGESELLSFYCLHDSGSGWTNKGTTQFTVCSVPALDSCGNQHAFTLPFINSAYAEQSPWTDLPKTPDNVNYITKNLNCSPKERVVILYKDNFLANLISDAINCHDIWPVEITGPFLNADIEDVNRPDIFKTRNTQSHSDNVINKNYSDSFIYDGEMEKKSGLRHRRKSVSFADDVMVYLYDKDSPADKFHPEPDNTTSSSSNLSEIFFDNNGLEWEDEFLALENCHLHNHKESCPFSSSLPTQNWTIPKPKHLSQSCLFLTHVNESDLEL
ncbi:hypothetical protein NL108_003948 [Boleophthalmus pectinirostris]|uniref:uncharacterized protein LOC110159766 n=1 Tax=Boleophthalmus pectinirostris TaxID=150288 RepID=UPI00242D2ED3|nr:uncharacterized protein LOC110159766 [Boleophthalmus pectinirostris]KAJ0044256.1 hypothetical protein NL108_003948 [Boleophthalmus pectinirostris]